MFLPDYIDRKFVHLFMRFKPHYFSFIIVFCFLIITSCDKQEPNSFEKYDPALESVFINDSNVFRNFNLGTKIDSVLNKELSKPKESDTDYLYYEYPIDTIGSFNVAYTFDNGGLNEIQSDIFINRQSKTDTLFNALKNYFDDHYGPSHVDMGFTVWSVPSEFYSEVKITLSNESTDFSVPNSPGKISIWIYPDK